MKVELSRLTKIAVLSKEKSSKKHSRSIGALSTNRISNVGFSKKRCKGKKKKYICSSR